MARAATTAAASDASPVPGPGRVASSQAAARIRSQSSSDIGLVPARSHCEQHELVAVDAGWKRGELGELGSTEFVQRLPDIDEDAETLVMGCGHQPTIPAKAW
jgi:hypothetical protein